MINTPTIVDFGELHTRRECCLEVRGNKILSCQSGHAQQLNKTVDTARRQSRYDVTVCNGGQARAEGAQFSQARAHTRASQGIDKTLFLFLQCDQLQEPERAASDIRAYMHAHTVRLGSDKNKGAVPVPQSTFSPLRCAPRSVDIVGADEALTACGAGDQPRRLQDV